MTTPPMKLLVLGLITVTGVLLPAAANATQKFPSAIYYHLYAATVNTAKVNPYMPPCSLCHTRGSTGPGTAQTPFALSAKARGLVASDTNLLNLALDAMLRDEVDSDGDGVPDIQELYDGTDPNTPADVSFASESGPNSGCGGNTKQRSPRAAGVPILGLLLLPVLRRLRRRK